MWRDLLNVCFSIFLKPLLCFGHAAGLPSLVLITITTNYRYLPPNGLQGTVAFSSYVNVFRARREVVALHFVAGFRLVKEIMSG